MSPILLILAPHELVYYGTSATNNPDTIDVSTLNSYDAITGTNDISTGSVDQGDFFMILAPSDHDIVTIIDDIFQQDVTSLFTRTEDVRTITSIEYHSYIIGPLNADTDGESYTVTIS